MQRAVAGHPDYRVSDDGRAFSRKVFSRWESIGPWQEMHPAANGSGHIQVRIDGVLTGLHRLILEAFVGPCPEGQECRHLNGNPGDNRLENLEWGTVAENAADRIPHGTSNRGERNGSARLLRGEVLAIRASRSAPSTLAARYGVSVPTVCNIRARRTWAWLA